MEYIMTLPVGLAMGLWMYSHAKNKKLEKPSVWIWIGLLFNIFGLITYLYWHGGTKKSVKKNIKKSSIRKLKVNQE